MKRVRLLSTLAASLALAAQCGTDPPQNDGGDAASQDAVPTMNDVASESNDDVNEPVDVPNPMCNAPMPLEPGAMPTAFNPMVLSPTRAMAGVAMAGQLPQHPSGLTEYKDGDLILANDRIAAVIERARPSSGYDPWGGKLIGLTLVRNQALVDPADFNEAIVTLGRFTLQTQAVGVINDGSNGQPAVIRAVGLTKPVPFIDEFARPIAGQPLGDFVSGFEYVLAPGAEHIDMYLLVNHQRLNTTTIDLSLHAFFQRYRMPGYTDNVGFDINGNASKPYIGWINDNGASYAWFDPNSTIASFLSVSGFDAFQAPVSINLAPCTQVRRHMARIVVGGAGVDGLNSAVARTRMQTQREIRGNVVDGSGAPAVGARVHATSMDGMRYITRVPVDAMGNYVLHVPSAEPVRLLAWRSGDGASPTVDVPMASNTAGALRLPMTGTIDVAITSAMAATPARIQVIPMAGNAPTLPAMFGEQTPGNNRNHVVFPQDGRATLRVPVGRYRVLGSRGFEYTIADTMVDVTAGATTMVRSSIDRVVDTSNVMCGDFHIHTNRSPDAPDPARYKLQAMAADGLEIAVRTDHEYTMDFEQVIAELNLGQYVFGVPALELTTFTWGHFNVFPLTPDPTRPNNGVFDWPNRLPPAVFADVRARPERPVLIINHPVGMAAGAYFTAAQYNAATNTPGRMNMWDNDFNVVEVFNESSFAANRNASVRDWFGLLKGGRRVYSVGSSDSHSIMPNSPVGYPRTCMNLGTDNPRMLSNNQIRDAVAVGHATISGGAYLTVSMRGGAVGPGDEAMGVGAMAAVDVRVQAAPWVRLSTLEVIVDGVTVETRPLMGNAVDRLRSTINVPVAATGSWVVFAVNGLPLEPLYPTNMANPEDHAAFAVSNPIFLRR